MTEAEFYAGAFVEMVDHAIEATPGNQLAVRVEEASWFDGWQVASNGILLAKGMLSQYRIHRGEPYGPEQTLRMAFMDTESPAEGMRFVVSGDRPLHIDRFLEIGEHVTFKVLNDKESAVLWTFLDSEDHDQSAISSLASLSPDEKIRMRRLSAEPERVYIPRAQKNESRNRSRPGRKVWRNLTWH